MPIGTDTSFDWRGLALVARGSQLEQLSQVARITVEDGYYRGETLAYLAIAFIPRLVWPEKPQITPGQWFAARIGRGSRLPDGRFSNSINMTLAGELYLNFGWPAAVAGLGLLSVVFAAVWEASGFYWTKNNPVGLTLGLAILLQACFSTATTAIVSLVFQYLMALLLGWLLSSIVARRVRRGQDPVARRRSPALEPAP
jgi:hypothetical protein